MEFNRLVRKSQTTDALAVYDGLFQLVNVLLSPDMHDAILPSQIIANARGPALPAFNPVLLTALALVEPPRIPTLATRSRCRWHRLACLHRLTLAT